MHNKSRTLTPTAFFILISGLATADTLEFKNGDRLTGKLIREENGTIYFNSDILGEISLPDSAAKLHIESKVEVDAPDTMSIEESATPKPETPGEETSATTPSSKRKRKLPYGGKMIRIFSFLYPLKKWDSNLFLGFNIQSGEREKQDISFRYDSQYETEKSEFKLDARYSYGFQKDNGRKTKNSDRYSATFRWRRDLSERLFLQTTSDILKDLVKDIDEEYNQSVGAGWRILNKPRMKASITPAATARYQVLSGRAKEIDFLTTVFQDFSLQLNEKFTFYEETNFSIDPSDTNVFSYEMLTKFEARISKRMNFNIRWEFDFDNNLAPGVDNSQQRFLFGLELDF